MTDQEVTCSQCDAAVRRADRFCESCGASLSEARRVAIPRSGLSTGEPCADCGNEAHLTSTAPSAATGARSPIATRRISAGSC